MINPNKDRSELCVGVLERVSTMLYVHAECQAQWGRPHRQQELGISGAVSCLEAWQASALNLLCKVVRHVVMSPGIAQAM